jgi:glycerophosphoryl diester phosphodiesterase
VDLVECDVHQTRDGEVLVVHDPTLERTTTGLGAVRDRAWAEVAAVTVRGTPGEPVPRLAEVLALIRPAPVGLLLEIKNGPDGGRYPGIEERVLALLRAAGVADRTTVMAFDWAIVERLRALAAPVRLTGLLGKDGAERLGGVGPRPRRPRSRDRADAPHAGGGPRGARHGAHDRGLDGERAGRAPPGARRGRGLRDDRSAGPGPPAAEPGALTRPVGP